jgi:hypothetical protein
MLKVLLTLEYDNNIYKLIIFFGPWGVNIGMLREGENIICVCGGRGGLVFDPKKMLSFGGAKVYL